MGVIADEEKSSSSEEVEREKSMHPDLEKLIVLQGHDVEAKRLRDELAALPKHVADLEAKAKAVEGQRAVVLDLIAKEEALRRRQESDIKDHQAKIARIRKQLDLATTTVQVTAFEHEISFAQSEISRLEDAELESMERTEGFDAQKAWPTKPSPTPKRLSSASVPKRPKPSIRTSNSSRPLKKSASSSGPKSTKHALSVYDRISKAKGTAVAEALNQKCMACQMMLRPQRWNDLRDRDNDSVMMTCESCGRLLYYDPARDSPQRKPVAVESIAASIIRSL